MFTGIIRGMGSTLVSDGSNLTVRVSESLEGLKEGDSISINGTCLTVNHIDGDHFSVDTMPETIKRTNLGKLKPGVLVNLERALTLESPLGGHIVQGHVDATGVLKRLDKDGDAMLMEFEAPSNVIKYVVEKGFIAVDGISLTVVEVSGLTFTVSVVKYTLEHTTLGCLGTGSIVNIEVDILAKYVEKLLPGLR